MLFIIRSGGIFDKKVTVLMNFELFVPCPNRDVQRMSIDRAVHLGWDGLVLTQTIHAAAKIPEPLEPTELNPECEAIVKRNYGLCVLGSYPAFPQFTRLNLETDSTDDARAFIKNAKNTRFSLLSITPQSDAVLKAAAQSSDLDIDIISVDPQKLHLKNIWKDLKAAVSRGIIIEFRYAHFIDYKKRQALFNALSSATFVLRGRNILLSFGSPDTEVMRSPSDVLNIANLLGIKNPEKLTNEVAKQVLAKGLARQTHVGITRELPDTVSKADDDDDSLDFDIVIKTPN